MKRFKVISLDMFQTLVNVQSRTSYVWKPILQQGYSDALAAELGALLLGQYYLVYDRARELGEFYTTREIYQESFNTVFLLHSLDFDSLDAVDILFAEHRQAELYAETEHFLGRLFISETPLRMCFGAKKAGITACWLNRNQETWSSEVRPDYIVTTLDEFYELL
ncbi:hypothetical protein H1230_21110 [Paenibacillus sp. 19GGS1-52]|uniref:hypothetical protein n=1 Tax=Paenibacillus sp. 19GGS1-52 TaxID=2758563 RepID=UPI001EFA6950|nr:hypothetical protein [Paenibacillus sp. 19GGS1-52]ULO05562.1 hypothetical protein H1230_21110 [Paenibacillus sp. 19GGS1-52]